MSSSTASLGLRGSTPREGRASTAMSVETFHDHINNVYLLIEQGSAILFDCGSGLDSSRRDLALGFAVVREVFGESARYEDLDWCVISHAHFDHFGGANVLKQEIARAPRRPRARRPRALLLRRTPRHRLQGLRRLLAARRRARRRAGRSARDVHGGQERLSSRRRSTGSCATATPSGPATACTTCRATARASCACRCTTCS